MWSVRGGLPISPNVVVFVIAVTAIVSVAAWISKSLRSALVLNPYVVKKRGQVHRLFTAGLVHADAMHLLFNMMTLWFFAGGVVRYLGVVRFLLLYFTAVVVGFVPTTLRHMNSPAYNSLGASGAVAAVTFSAIALQPGLRVGIPFVPVLVPGIVYGVLYLAYSAWHSYRARDGINHDAHFTGAVYGAVLTYVFEPDRVQRTLGHLI